MYLWGLFEKKKKKHNNKQNKACIFYTLRLGGLLSDYCILWYFNLNNKFKKMCQQLLSMMPVFSLLESHVVSTSEFAGLSYTYAL